jgi:hypothetical protein
MIGCAGLIVGFVGMIASSIMVSTDPALYGLNREDPAYNLKAAGDVLISSAISAVAAIALVAGIRACIDVRRPLVITNIAIPRSALEFPPIVFASIPQHHIGANRDFAVPLLIPGDNENSQDPNRVALRAGFTLQTVETMPLSKIERIQAAAPSHEIMNMPVASQAVTFLEQQIDAQPQQRLELFSDAHQQALS